MGEASRFGVCGGGNGDEFRWNSGCGVFRNVLKVGLRRRLRTGTILLELGSSMGKSSVQGVCDSDDRKAILVNTWMCAVVWYCVNIGICLVKGYGRGERGGGMRFGSLVSMTPSILKIIQLG